MKHKGLKKAVVLGILAVLLAIPAMAATASNGDLASSSVTTYGGYTVAFQQNADASLELDFTLGDYDIGEVAIDGATYARIEFEGKVLTTEKGFAELPFIHAAVRLPPDRNVSLAIEGANFVEYKLDYPLLPSRGVIYRHQDPDDVPYAIDAASVVDAWYPGDVATAVEPYILRDVRGTNVYVYPFQYNAQKGRLRVYTNVTVRLVENESAPINALTRVNPKISREMDSIYRAMFVNYGGSSPSWSYEIGEMGEILVIYTARDASVIQPYVQWKQEKGFQVHTQQVATGTNVKSLIQNEYNANPNLLYVQLVGDWADIKSDTLGTAPMDPMLGCVAGSDYYPELIIGRFSAETTTHVTTQINKAITYEKAPDMSGTWYDDGLGIGSGEGAGIGDDGEIDYEHIDIIKEYKLLPYTYSNVVEAYVNPTDTFVANAVNSGLTVVNYCGHGSSTSWGTSGFNNADVYNLTNGSKLPVIVSVACLNGTFHLSGECFAEAWLRHDGGGAVATLMATISQPWQPPMRGQDYMNDLLTGGYDYSSNPGNGISTTEGRTTFGSIAFNGLVLMYTESSSSSDRETIQTWTLFGDASLQVRTDTPASIDLSNTAVYEGAPFTTQVTSSGSPVEGALVSLSQGANVFSGFTDGSGYVTINHSLTVGSAKLVVTGLNLETEYHDIEVQSSGPTPTPTSTPTQGPPTPTPTATPTFTPTPPPGVMHVDDIQMSYVQLNKNRFQVFADVTIRDQLGNPVDVATVSVQWTHPKGVLDDQRVTGGTGVATFDIINKPGDYQICVTDVTKTGWTYDPNQNVKTCETLTVQ